MKQNILAALTLLVLTGGTTRQAFSQTESSDSARRNLVHSLIQSGKPEQALQQLYSVPNPTGWDQFMKGEASEMLGQPVKAAHWFRAAVEQDSRNDQFRTKAITSLIALVKCDDALQVCTDGTRLTIDPKKRQFYEDKIKEIQQLKEALVKGAENIARHKLEHHDQLQSVVE